MFNLTTHINGEPTTVTARRSGRAIAVEGPSGTQAARNVNQAARIARKIVGPLLERADRTGAAWGLYIGIENGPSAIFGRFPPGPASPTVAGPKPDPSAPIEQIYQQWKRDGTALGALEAATKIIKIYADQSRRQAAA